MFSEEIDLGFFDSCLSLLLLLLQEDHGGWIESGVDDIPWSSGCGFDSDLDGAFFEVEGSGTPDLEYSVPSSFVSLFPVLEIIVELCLDLL